MIVLTLNYRMLRSLSVSVRLWAGKATTVTILHKFTFTWKIDSEFLILFVYLNTKSGGTWTVWVWHCTRRRARTAESDSFLNRTASHYHYNLNMQMRTFLYLALPHLNLQQIWIPSQYLSNPFHVMPCHPILLHHISYSRHYGTI